MDQDGTWHGGRPQHRRPCDVRSGPTPPKKGAEPPPQFLAHLYCDQTAECTTMPLGMKLGLSPGDFVLDGDPAPPQRGGGAPKFSSHVYCDQTAGWNKMTLGTEVGLSPGDFVVDGNTAPLPKKGVGAFSAIFGKFLPCPNGWMHHDATWYGGRPQPRGLCFRCGPRPSPQKGSGVPSSIFGPCLLGPNVWMDQDGTWHGGRH